MTTPSPTDTARKPRQNRKVKLVAAAAAAGLLLAACSSSDDGDSGSSSASGEVVISGSSTVEPISALNAEKFQTTNADVAISVDGPGTGDGFELFCSGETDISDASRAIKDEEKQACEQNGVDFVELQVAIDGLSVLTSPENGDISCLANTDLYALLGPESEGFDKWSSADQLASELDAPHAPYPDASLVVTAPGEESGTYDTFVEIVIEEIAEERNQEVATRPDYTASPNDNVIIEGIAGDPTSLGWVGYAFFFENKDSVKAIEYEGEDGTCVAPTDATIADGSYGLSRPLFIYVNKENAGEGTATRSFVDFYLSQDGIASVSEAGYVQLDGSAQDATKTTWEDFTGGGSGSSDASPEVSPTS